MRKLRVDVILLSNQRVVLEHLLDNQSGKRELISKADNEKLEGLENMLSDIVDSLLRDEEVLLHNATLSKGGPP